VRFVAAPLVSEVTAVAAVIVLAVFGHKAFVASPGLDQGAVHAEVFAAEQLTLIGLRHDLVEQFEHRIMRNEPLAVFAEDRGHPHRIVHGQAHKPAKEHVVLDLLHEHALGAHAVEHLQQHRAQQLLRCNTGAAALDVRLVHPGKQSIHRHQCLVDHLADLSQRMVSRYKVIKPFHQKQAFGKGVSAAHLCLLEAMSQLSMQRLIQGFRRVGISAAC